MLFHFVKWNERTAYYAGSRHSIFPSEPNRELFSAVLLHFKFVGDFPFKMQEAIQEKPILEAKEYKRYAAWLMKKPMSTLLDEMYSVKFSGYQSLVDECCCSLLSGLSVMNSAVLFLIFNRPEQTRRVFQAIREARPPRLYISADGPRMDHPKENLICEDVRRIATDVDWECGVKTQFHSQNLDVRMVKSAV